MPRSRLVMLAAGVTFALAAIAPLTGQQLPLSPAPRAGAIVTPVFEGWYPNKDGTFSISFGYFNRNSEEAIDIPIGPDNFDRARRAESGTADALRAEAALGRVRREGAGGLRQEGSGVDAQGPRRRRTRFPATCIRTGRSTRSKAKPDRATRRRCCKFERDGPGGRGPGRHHRRTDHGDGRQAASRSPCGRRTTAKPSGSVASAGRGGRAGDAHVVQASGPGQRDVHAADRARAGDRRIGHDDGDVQRAGRVHRSASARTTRRASPARATRSAAGRTDS